MDYRMQLQLAGFVIFALVCIGWTRLVYYDGVHGRLARLKLHCKIHAGMIFAVSTWAISIGFYVHAKSMEVIEQQQQTIQNLATSRINSVGETDDELAHQISNLAAAHDDRGIPPAEFVTAAGNRIIVGYSDRPMLRDSGGNRRDSGGDRFERGAGFRTAGSTGSTVRGFNVMQELTRRSVKEQ